MKPSGKIIIRTFTGWITIVKVVNQSARMQFQLFDARSTAASKMATPMQKVKCALWFNNARYVNRVQRHRETESGVDSPSKLSIYAFYKCSVIQVVCVKAKFPLLQSVCMELEYQLHVRIVTNSSHDEHLEVVK
jgi:hypothetical protein